MKRRFFTVLAAVVLVSGCSSTINPQYVPLGIHDLVPVHSEKPISVINAQKINLAEIKIVTGLHDFTVCEANLGEWTNQVIMSINQWLTSNGIQINENATKILKVSIEDPQMKIPPDSCEQTHLVLRVETGEGLVRIYPADATAVGKDRSAGYALYYAVLSLIHDGSIIHYISQE